MLPKTEHRNRTEKGLIDYKSGLQFIKSQSQFLCLNFHLITKTFWICSEELLKNDSNFGSWRTPLGKILDPPLVRNCWCSSWLTRSNKCWELHPTKQLLSFIIMSKSCIEIGVYYICDSSGSRIFQTEGASIPEFVAKTYYLARFLCLQLHKNGRNRADRGRASCRQRPQIHWWYERIIIKVWFEIWWAKPG